MSTKPYLCVSNFADVTKIRQTISRNFRRHRPLRVCPPITSACEANEHSLSHQNNYGEKNHQYGQRTQPPPSLFRAFNPFDGEGKHGRKRYNIQTKPRQSVFRYPVFLNTQRVVQNVGLTNFLRIIDTLVIYVLLPILRASHGRVTGDVFTPTHTLT